MIPHLANVVPLRHHHHLKVVGWIALVLAIAVLAGMGLVWRFNSKVMPIPLSPPSPDISLPWILEAIEKVDRICGPVPFVIDATRYSFHYECQRPENVPVRKR
jgi:hypothetical protein